MHKIIRKCNYSVRHNTPGKANKRFPDAVNKNFRASYSFTTERNNL